MDFMNDKCTEYNKEKSCKELTTQASVASLQNQNSNILDNGPCDGFFTIIKKGSKRKEKSTNVKRAKEGNIP